MGRGIPMRYSQVISRDPSTALLSAQDDSVHGMSSLLDEFRSACDLESPIQMNVDYTDAQGTQPASTEADKYPSPNNGHLLPKVTESFDLCDRALSTTKTDESQ